MRNALSLAPYLLIAVLAVPITFELAEHGSPGHVHHGIPLVSVAEADTPAPAASTSPSVDTKAAAPAPVGPAFATTLKTYAFAASALFGATILASIAAAFAKGLPSAVAWMKAHSVIQGHAAITAVIQSAEDALGNIVLAAEQTTVADLKAQLASPNGITEANYKAQLAKVKDDVLAQFKAQASAGSLMVDLQTALAAGAKATGTSPTVETWAATTLEKLVGAMPTKAA